MRERVPGKNRYTLREHSKLCILDLFFLQNSTYTFKNFFLPRQNFENVSENASYSSYQHSDNSSLILTLETYLYCLSMRLGCKKRVYTCI